MWFKVRTIFAKEATARPHQAGSVEKVLPGGWGNYRKKKIRIMVWGQTQWKQAILGQVAGSVSPVVEGGEVLDGPMLKLRAPGEAAEICQAAGVVPSASNQPTAGRNKVS